MATTNSNNVCNDTAYLNSIDQKTRFQLLNIPPVRYDNLATNPYTNINPTTGKLFTKDDLDMRRKAEILKYSSNRMSTQTNNLTNAQRYAQLVRGLYQQRTYSRAFIQANTDQNGLLQICPPGTVIKTPSTASDIPGPPIYLYEDDNVPLYNFNKNLDSAYGIQNQNANPYTKNWDFVKSSNIVSNYLSNTITYSTFTNIYIMYTESPAYFYNISTPISLSVSGNLTLGSSYVDSQALRINISAVYVNVKYSYSDVTLNPAPSIIYEHAVSGGVPIDISINIPVGQTSFTTTCYLGKLQINNLKLLTVKGYIYDIQTSINYQIIYPSGRYSSYCSTPVLTTIINTSLNNVYPQIKRNSTASGGSVVNPFAFPQLTITGIPG